MGISIKIDAVDNGYVVDIKRKICMRGTIQHFVESVQTAMQSPGDLLELPEGIAQAPKLEKEEERLIFNTLSEVMTCIESAIRKTGRA